jgi:hypothetical protein
MGDVIIGGARVNATTPLQTASGAGEAHIGSVGGDFATVAVEITKTAGGDTTAYTAKDVFNAAVGAGLTFANLARVAGGSGVIVKARLATDQKTNVARFRLHLWKTAPTFINDNSPFLYLYANEATYIGSIDFDALAMEDATNSTAAYSQRVGNLLPFVCGATASLFGEIEVLDAFTPTSGQKITVTLTASRN